MFSLGGIGTLLQQSVTFGDIPCVQAITLILASVICISTAIVDTLAQLVDPRLRKRAKKSRAAAKMPSLCPIPQKEAE